MAEQEENKTNIDPETAIEDGSSSNDDTKSLDDDAGSGSRKKILMIVAPLVVLTLVGLGLYLSGIIGGKTEAETDLSAVEEEIDPNKAKEEYSKTVTFLPLPDMIVNLDTQSSQPRYLRLSVQLELENEADKVAVETVLPRVVDKFQTYLRELRVEDLRGSKGYHRLQIELLSRVNTAAYPTKVKSVLFQEMLIQ